MYLIGVDACMVYWPPSVLSRASHGISYFFADVACVCSLSFSSWQYNIPSINSLSLTNTTCFPCFLASFWIGYSFFRLSSIAFGNCSWIPKRMFLSHFARSRTSIRFLWYKNLATIGLGLSFECFPNWCTLPYSIWCSIPSFS